MVSSRQFKIYRWPWIITAILVIAVVWILYRCYLWPLEVTTLYIVRHAEKVENGADPPLSAAGQARADELARVLADQQIDAVFVTNFLRTQQTGAPLAAAAGVTPQQYQASDTQGVVNTIITNHPGERVLVVGHSNTVDDIAAGFGVSGLADLPEARFDRLFVVHRFADIAVLDQLRYGAATP